MVRCAYCGAIILGRGGIFIALLKAWFCNENCYHEALGLDED